MNTYEIPEQLIKMKEEFLNYKAIKTGCGKSRMQQFRASIDCLYQFLAEKGITDLTKIKQTHIIKFQYYLYQVKRYTSYSTINNLNNLKTFCTYLHHKNLIWKNPFSDMTYIKPPELEHVEIKRHYNFSELITRWTNFLKKEGYNISGVDDKIKSVRLFINFLSTKDIKSIYKVKEETIDQFKEFLKDYQYEPGKYYNPFTQIINLRYVCQFLLFLHRAYLIKKDPSLHINIRKYYREIEEEYRGKRFPRDKHKEINVKNLEIKTLLEKFIQYRLSTGASHETMRNYVRALEKFDIFINQQNITDLKKVTKRDIMDYQCWLYNATTNTGAKYAQNTLHSMIINLRCFFRYLTKYDYLACDPSSSVDLPNKETGIPRTCMDEREVKILLEQPDTINPVGLRDRAIMEVFYSTGIRANELCELKTQDIDFTQGLCRVDEPKGGKSYQRIVPIGRIACDYVNQYLTKVRPVYDKNNEKRYLFLSNNGRKLHRSYLSSVIRKYLFRCGLRKKITTHSFRVSCATHMLKNDADISYVRKQLGHKSIKTTEGYIRLVPKDLKAVHQRTHPREKIFEKLVAG